MENKIKQYVNYQFRFDNREDIDSLKEEIISNLIDRYHEKVNMGKTQEEAYIEAIKSMGDFSEDMVNRIPEEYSMKPTIPDILLISSTILSIFGLLLTLFGAIIGSITTALSIILYSSSAYYLYSYSQYIRKEEMDIGKHNLFLVKIYKYMKTNFIFWAISLSIIMSSLVMGKITGLMVIANNRLTFYSLSEYVIIYLVLFFIGLIIFLLIFLSIYQKLMHHYYLLTGSSNLKGKIRESYEFLYHDEHQDTPKNILFSKRFFPFLGMLVIMIQLLFPFNVVFDVYEPGFSAHYYVQYHGLFIFQMINLLNTNYYTMVLIPDILLIVVIVIMTLTLTKVIKNQFLLIMSYYLWFIGTVVMYSIYNGSKINASYIFFKDNIAGIYALIMILLLTIILIVRSFWKLSYSKDR